MSTALVGIVGIVSGVALAWLITSLTDFSTPVDALIGFACGGGMMLLTMFLATVLFDW